MKRKFLFGAIIALLAVLGAVFFWQVEAVKALPEYSAQTGEPCATCHISPSGGGPRTPRGQAWIADLKPGFVLDLLSALELLGVELDVDPADYTTVPDEILPAQPLPLSPGQVDLLHRHLSEYPGN